MTTAPILIAAPSFHPWDLGTYVEAALKRLGRPSVRFSIDDAASPGPAFARALHATDARQVIGLKLDGLPPSALRTARRAGVRVLLWQVDCFDATVPAWIRPRLAAVDAVAITAGGLVPAYQRLTAAPVRWVMEGVHLPAFRTVIALPAAARQTYGSDIAFVGNIAQPPVPDRRLAQHRMRLLRRLSRAFDVTVWGPQRPSAVRFAERAHLTVRRWPAYHEELVKICQASAIVLGLNTINTVPHYFSNRTFLTLASGGFHLTHYVPGLEDLFGNHRDLVWFHTDEECEELCRFYLKRPSARLRIAEHGRARVRRTWSLTRQVAQLVQMLDDVSVSRGSGIDRA